MANVPDADAGLGSGIVNVSVQIAAALGLAVFGTIAADHTRALSAAGESMPEALTGGYHTACMVAIYLDVAVLLFVFVMRRVMRQRAAIEVGEPARV